MTRPSGPAAAFEIMYASGSRRAGNGCRGRLPEDRPEAVVSRAEPLARDRAGTGPEACPAGRPGPLTLLRLPAMVRAEGGPGEPRGAGHGPAPLGTGKPRGAGVRTARRG